MESVQFAPPSVISSSTSRWRSDERFLDKAFWIKTFLLSLVTFTLYFVLLNAFTRSVIIYWRARYLELYLADRQNHR
ncbi:MAG: hypothetical protein QOI34_1625 [Verrucomicrobiota bacterium]